MGSELEPDGGGALFAPLPAIPDLWSCRGLEIVGDDRLIARFDQGDGQGQLEITVGPKDMPGPVFRTHGHCAVRYRGRLPSATERGRAEVAMLVFSIGAAVDQRMEEALRLAGPGRPPTLAEALGRRSGETRLVFARATLLALLAPELSLGADLGGGWALTDVYPASHLRESVDATLQLVLDFRRTPEPGRMRIVVGPRQDDRRSFASTTHFALTHDAREGAEAEGAAHLRTLVAFVLQLRDHDGLEVVFTDVASDVQSLLLAGPEGEDSAQSGASSTRVLNLAISSECHQQCLFCSVKELEPARDGGDPLHARLCADLLSNRDAGVVHYRLNGYDPLTYSRVLDVLRYATRIGYRRTDVFSPCTTLADPAFCDAVLAALPPERTFHVPLYALESALHDRFVGRVGAHALVLRALDNLEARAGAASVRILSVATTDNLGELPRLAEFSAQRGFLFRVHLPYPSHESRGDRFFSSMPKQTAVAEILAASHRAGHPLRVEGVAPCVVYRRMEEAGVALHCWLTVPDEPPLLPGTEYRRERFRHRGLEVEHSAYHPSTVPCPHATRCALATVCAQEILRGYVELHGGEEFQPVSLRQLLGV